VNDHDLDLFEAELQGLKPARPPQDFATRLSRAVAREDQRPKTEDRANSEGRAASFSLAIRQLRWHLRWLAPATVMALAALVVLRSDLLGLRSAAPGIMAAPAPALKADDVKIDSTLVSSYDAVARLPDGEPVRFRCEEWMDEVRLEDSARGLVYSQRVPRVTVVPVRFETY
jgi:hypothetical protein